MSFPDQIQRQLFSRPMSLASDIRPFAEGRAVIDPARSVATRTLPSETDPIGELSIGLNPELSMSSSRDAFLGHSDVSRASVRSPIEHDGEVGCEQTLTGNGQ